MAAEIKFDRDLAKTMQCDLFDVMYTYTDNQNGSDYYSCAFCSQFKYLHSSEPIKHSPSCLGAKMMAELDKRLAEYDLTESGS